MTRWFRNWLCGLAVLAVCTAPVEAPAQGLLGTLGGAITAVQYVPPAFLTTNFASPTLAAGALANSPDFDINFDFRCAQGVNGQTGPDKYESCYNSVLFGAWSNTPCSGGSSAETMFAGNIVWEQGDNGGLFRFNVNNANCPGGAPGSPNNNNSANDAYGPSPATNTLFNGEWHHMRYYGSVNKSSATNKRAGGVFIDQTQVVTGLTDISANGLGWTGTQTLPWSLGPLFVNAFETTSPAQQPTHFQIANLSVDTSTSPVVGSTNVPINPISNFTTAAGLPVDQGPNCATAYGHQPTLCHRSANFLTDTGSLATDFTITAASTSTVNNKMYLAPTAPGEVPDRPYIKSAYITRYNGSCTEASGTCTFSNANIGNPIDVGDKVCFVPVMTGNNGTFNEGFGISTYTDIFGGTQANANNVNMSVLCKAWSGSAVTKGTSMGSIVLTWTGGAGGGYGSGGGGAGLLFINFGKYGAGGTTPTIAAQSVTSTSASTSVYSFAPVTTPAGNSLIVSLEAVYDFSFSTSFAAVGPPTTSQNYIMHPTGTNGPMLNWEKHSGAGSFTLGNGQGAPGGNRPLDIVLVLN